jgi:hypothetical protein
VSDDKFLVVAGFLPTRVRRTDLPLAVLFGIAYWMTTAWLLYKLRLFMELAARTAALAEHPYSDPGRVLAGVISSMVVVLFIAHLQVAEGGIPTGLTLKRAFLPAIVAAVFAFGATPIVISTSGSVAYAAMSVVIHSATTLVFSLVLRRVRLAL